MSENLQLDPDRLFSRHPEAKEIIEILKREGWQTVIVGGAVRDALRENFEQDFTFSPADSDVDIATEASLKTVKSILSGRGYRFVEVGASFGVLIVVTPKGKEYEVAHFREESDYDGRRPNHVRRTDSLKRDVKRRDFTVNGLAMDLEGRVIDHVGGIEDLKRGLIKAIGDPRERFTEDLLRPLRAVRFACHLEGKIEERTYEALVEIAPRVTEISWERIGQEMMKIMETDSSARGMRILKESGLLEELLPEMAANAGVKQSEEYHPEGDVLTHSLKAMEVADDLNFPPLVKLATFLHDVGKREALERNRGEHMGGHSQIGAKKTRRICRRLRLSNEETDKVVWIVENHMRGAILPRMGRGKQIELIGFCEDEKKLDIDDVWGRYDRFAALLQTLIADSESSAHGPKGWLPPTKELARLLPHLHNLEKREGAREMINGNDLLALGLEEGPKLGALLEELHRLIYVGEIKSRSEALQRAKKMLKEELD